MDTRKRNEEDSNIICSYVVFTAGCDRGNRPEQIKGSIYPNMKVYAVDAGTKDYYYVVDKNTGVVYIQFEGTRTAGITPALNADGTPMTADQLGLK